MMIAVRVIGIWIALAVLVLINFDDYPASGAHWASRITRRSSNWT